MKNLLLHKVQLVLNTIAESGTIAINELAEKLEIITAEECKYYCDTAIRLHKERAAQRKAEYEAEAAARKAQKAVKNEQSK